MHVFCSTCINEIIENAELAVYCPLCHSEINQDSLVNVPSNDKLQSEESCGDKSILEEDMWQSSTKISSVEHFIFYEARGLGHGRGAYCKIFKINK